MEPRRIVLITGCSDGGIGAALASVLARKGCTVYASSRSLNTMSSPTFEHPNIKKIAMDVTKDDSVNAGVDAIYAKHGRIDIVISNAGIHCVAPLLDVPIEKSQQVFDTNLFGLMRLTRAIVPRMAERRKGLVVAIGSVRAEVSTPWTGIYSSSKAALQAYTETLTMECRPLGVDVMLINPGAVTSNIVKNQGAAAQQYALPATSLYKDFIESMIHAMYTSQSKQYGSMDTSDFAEQAARAILAKNPPSRMRLGSYKSTFLIALLQWLPKNWASWLVWRVLSRSK